MRRYRILSSVLILAHRTLEPKVGVHVLVLDVTTQVPLGLNDLAARLADEAIRSRDHVLFYKHVQI